MSGAGTAIFENLEPGQVIRGHGFAACSDNGGQESDDAYTEPVVLPPHLSERPMIFTEQPAEFFTCLPIGTEVLLHHDWSSIGVDESAHSPGWLRCERDLSGFVAHAAMA